MGMCLMFLRASCIDRVKDTNLVKRKKPVIDPNSLRSTQRGLEARALQPDRFPTSS